MIELTLPDQQYFKIGEVARLVGVKPSVLRFWETEFFMIRPRKTNSGHRLYTRRHIERIAAIKDLLYEDQYTIAGARKKLRELGTGRALEEGTLSVEPDHRSRFRKIREELEQIRAML